jgi:hypothetical protein
MVHKVLRYKTSLQVVWFAVILTGRFQCDFLWHVEMVSKAMFCSNTSDSGEMNGKRNSEFSQC